MTTTTPPTALAGAGRRPAGPPEMDAEDVEAVTAAFLDELPAYREALRAGARGDAGLMRVLCHELATSFALVGAGPGERLARDAEAALRQGCLLKLDALAAMLLLELEKAVAVLGSRPG